MDRSRLLAIFAWYFDLVLIESIVWPLHDLVDSGDGWLYHLSVLVRVIIFILTIVYHVKWKKNTSWLSPGEYLTGQRLISGNKAAVKLFSVHRTLLFVVILINILCTIKTVETSYYGMADMGRVMLINYGLNFLLLFGSFKLSEVKVVGVISIAIALGFILGNHAVDYSRMDIQSDRNMFIAYLLLLLVNGWVYYYYGRHKVANPLRVTEN
jgi:hypothetical protein